MRVAVLFSGGKDSTYATFVALQRGWSVTQLISVRPDNPDSLLFHVPNLHLTPLLSQAMAIPLVEESANTGEAAELAALQRAFARIEADGILVGAIASDYQHARINGVAEKLGLRVFAPLWRRDPRDLIREYLDAGFRIVFSSVSAEGFDESWLGRAWDERTIEDLLQLHESHGVHPCGEGGEFETLVLDGPIFGKKVEILQAEPIWFGASGEWRVKQATLSGKS